MLAALWWYQLYLTWHSNDISYFAVVFHQRIPPPQCRGSPLRWQENLQCDKCAQRKNRAKGHGWVLILCGCVAARRDIHSDEAGSSKTWECRSVRGIKPEPGLVAVTIGTICGHLLKVDTRSLYRMERQRRWVESSQVDAGTPWSRSVKLKNTVGQKLKQSHS